MPMPLVSFGRHFAIRLSLVALMLSARNDAHAADGYRVYIVDPPLSNSAIRPDAPLPESCVERDHLQIMAARGEYEPASFVIETQVPLSQVHVQMSDLRSESGEIAGAAVDVRVVAPVFRYTSDFPATMNWILVHDPNLIAVRDDPQPGALKPGASEVARAWIKTNHFTREPVDAPVLQPADVSHRQQFWLTMHVPQTADSGTFHGTVTITANDTPDRILSLELEVPEFDLLDPAFEYSVYYPAWLEGDLPQDNPQRYAVLSADEYRVDLENMVAHGCRNPNIYPQPRSKPDGSLDFTPLDTVLALREQAGMPKGRLYLLGAGAVNSSQKISPEQYRQNVVQVRELVDHLRQHGYGDVHLMGADEATGEALFVQRDAWQSVHEGGAKIFVAHYAGYTEGIGDLLDLPIMLHPMHAILDRHSLMPAERFLSMPPEVQEGLDVDLLTKPDVGDRIGRIHQAGHRVMTYMDPCAGHVWVEHHRRMRGLGLWKAGLDGTMTWAYTHITQPRYTQPGPFQVSIGFVLRGAEASFDTLSWEAYREGYDDARYLATLLDAMCQARQAERDAEFVAETQRWLDGLRSDADLNDWRREMASRTRGLLVGP